MFSATAATAVALSDATPNSAPNFNSVLSIDHIFLEVRSYLNRREAARLATTSKAVNQVSYSVVRDLDFSWARGPSEDHRICGCWTRYCHCRLHGITEERLAILIPKYAKIERLSLSRSFVKRSGLGVIAPYCAHLIELDFSSCGQFGEPHNDIQAMAPNLKNLKVFNAYRYITDSHLMAISRHCLQLLSLRLQYCRYVRGPGLRAIAEHCQKLTELDLKVCRKLVDDQFLKHCNNLKRLKLDDCCAMISDQSLRFISTNCQHLTELDLSYSSHLISDAGLQAIARGCSQLTGLNLSNCKRITDAGFQAIARGCSQLTGLNLSNCKRITDAGFQAIAQHCFQVKRLNLIGCKIGDPGLRALTQNCNQLELLHLGSGESTEQSGSHVIAENCSRLIELKLCGSFSIIDTGLQAIAQHSPKLSKLHLLLSSVTDDGIRAVAQHCNELTELALYDCRSVSETGIRAVAQGCNKLTKIVLCYGCPKITDEDLENIRKDFPHIGLFR